MKYVAWEGDMETEKGSAADETGFVLVPAIHCVIHNPQHSEATGQVGRVIDNEILAGQRVGQREVNKSNGTF